MSLTRRAALLLAVLVAGCGVTSEDSARQVEPPGGTRPVWPSQTSAPDDTGAVPVRLYMVHDGQIVPTVRHVSAKPSPGELLADLLAGPTDAEQQAGLTSALLGDDIITGVRLATGDHAVVELAPGLDETSRNDNVLAFGQIVCTLTAEPPITGVSFTSDGQAVDIPIADSSLSAGPLTTADYAALLADG